MEHRIKIDGQTHVLKEDQLKIKVSENYDGNPKIYGWSVEYKLRQHTDWYTSINNHIYYSKNSALEAALKVSKSWGTSDFRIFPIYKMSEPEWRNIKFENILGEPTSRLYDVTAWRIKEDCELKHGYKLNKDMVLIESENGSLIRCATNKIKTQILWKKSEIISHLKQNELIEEIDLSETKWVHPHLIKELRKLVS